MMNLPTRGNVPNMWQGVGTALHAGAGIVSNFNEDVLKQEQQKNLLQDMVEKRAQANLMMQINQAEEDRKQQEFDQKQLAQNRADQGKKKILDGKSELTDIPGAGQIPGISAMVQKPYTPDEQYRILLESGNIGGKEYTDAIKPPAASQAPIRWNIREIDGRIVQVNPITGEERDLGPATKPNATPTKWVINEIGGRKVQVNPETGEQRDLGPITPKISGKDVSTVKSKLGTISLARQQLQNIQNAFAPLKGSFSAGPGGSYIPTPSGKSFDAAVDAFRNTLTTLTRVPGVGSQSDFEAKLSQAPLPGRGDYEDVAQQKIDQLNQLVQTLDSGYSGLLAESGTDAQNTASQEIVAPSPFSPKPLGAKPGLKAIDANTAADYLKRAGGDRKKAKLLLKKDGYDING